MSNDPLMVDLRTSELQVFSQNGEDGLIHALILACGVSQPFFVEFGVGDGSECNTRLLAEVMGWSGVYLEPAEQRFAALAERYRLTQSVTCLKRAVTPETINDCFATAGVPDDFGVLSIDIDGQDYWCWEALAENYQPDIVVIECNTSVDQGVRTVETKGLAWDNNFIDSFGASVEALRGLGARKGYKLVHVDLCGVNAIFVRTKSLPAGLEFVGITERSPNYHLKGRGHPMVSPGRERITIATG